MADEVMIGDINVERADPRIAVVQPDRSRANLIEGLGNAASDVIQGVQQYRTQQAIGRVSQAYDVAGALAMRGAEFDPVTGEVLNQSDIDAKIDAELAGQIAAVQETSATAFNKIKASMEQGRGWGGDPYAAGLGRAHLQIENEIRKISAVTPGFEDVVRSTAREILGFDPTGFGIRNILQVPRQADPADENPEIKKINDEAEARMYVAAIHGINLDTSTALKQVTAERARATNTASLRSRIEAGNVTSDVAVTEYLVNQANPMLSLLESSVATLNPETGVNFSTMNNADRTQHMKNQQAILREREFNQAVQFAQDAADNNGGRITDADLTRIRERVNQRWAGMDTIIDTMSKSAYADRWAQELSKTANLQAWAMAPLVKFLNEGFNESIGLEMIKAMANTSSDSQLRLLIDRSPILSQVTGNGDESLVARLMGQTLDDLFNGRQPAPTGDPTIDRQWTQEVVSHLWRGTSDSPEGRRSVTNAFVQQQPDIAYSLFMADPANFAKNMDQSSWAPMRERFAAEIETYSGAVSQDLAALLDEARDPVGASGMTGDTSQGLYVRLNESLSSIDNMGFMKDASGKVFFSTDMNASRDSVRRTGTDPNMQRTGTGISMGLGDDVNQSIRVGLNKRVAPVLVNDTMISRMTNGRASNLDQFNEIFRRDAKAKAIDSQINAELTRTGVNQSFFGRTQNPRAPEQFEQEQNQYLDTLQGLLDLQQQRNVTTFGGAQ